MKKKKKVIIGSTVGAGSIFALATLDYWEYGL